MKYSPKWLLTAALTAAAMLAQGPGGPPPGGPRQGGQDRPQGDPVQFRVDFLTGRLGLNDIQKKDATAIFTAARTAAEEVLKQAPDKQKALQDAVKANATDSQIDAIAADIGALHAKTVAIQAKADAKFYALLTAEQKAKFAELRPHGPGGPGGPGGRPAFAGRGQGF